MSNVASLQQNSPPARHSAAPRTQGALARFLQLRGRRIFYACGAAWYTVPGRFLMSVPYQQMLDPEPDELRRLIRETGAFGARFPSLRWSGLASGMYLFTPGPYDMASLHSKHRPRVRHALKCFVVRPAQKSELIEQGRGLNLGTMTRQGRYDAEFGDRRRWETFVEAAFACSGISFPAVFCGARLVAYMVTCREDRWLHILHHMSDAASLPDFPNHLLTYSVTAQAAADQGLDAVCYGYLPLFAADGLHEYKLRFGYQFVPHSSAIQLNPLLGSVMRRRLFHSALRVARRLRPQDQRLETIETVLEGARVSARV
jgi:hypothetical protein